MARAGEGALLLPGTPMTQRLIRNSVNWLLRLRWSHNLMEQRREIAGRKVLREAAGILRCSGQALVDKYATRHFTREPLSGIFVIHPSK